jgi:LPXTG-motif cell wall-anchored protein
VPGLKLVGNVLTDTLANPGSYDDMLLTVFNNGNLPLTGLDLVAYHEADGKQAQAFETIHLDILNPANNTVTLSKGLTGATEQRSGEAVARVEASSMNVDGAEYRYGKTKEIWSSGPKVIEEKTDLMKPNMLMPSTFKAFNISLLIPQGWEGKQEIYLEVDRYYVSTDSSFQSNVNGASDANLLLFAAMPQSSVISISRDGTVRKENDGGMLLFAAADGAEEAEEDFSMYKTDLTFDRIQLDTSVRDLGIQATRWDNNGEPMVTLTVTNWAHIGADSRSANTVVMEAFLDEETEPVFRYSLPDEVSDKETWNFDLPLSLLTDGRSASKVTVKISGKNYKEVGDVDNSVVILLDTDVLSFLTQPDDVNAPAGSPAAFHAAVIGGRAPYKYQWQVKTPQGSWEDLPGENSDTLTLKAVTQEMSGNQYRLTVTDASGYSATSRAATLTVKQVPHTGDTAPLFWYAMGMGAAVSAILFILVKRKKESEAE